MKWTVDGSVMAWVVSVMCLGVGAVIFIIMRSTQKELFSMDRNGVQTKYEYRAVLRI